VEKCDGEPLMGDEFGENSKLKGFDEGSKRYRFYTILNGNDSNEQTIKEIKWKPLRKKMVAIVIRIEEI